MFKRGFKAWCENASHQARARLGVDAHEPLDPFALAESLSVTVLYPSNIPGISASALDTLLKDDSDSWSAVTLTLEPKPIIVLNSTHSTARRASDLAHELSHLLLVHKPSQTGVSPDGFLLTAYDRVQEDEANWLAGCLLLPREACLHVRRKRMDNLSIARVYGISRDMVTYRLNMTGVDRQLGVSLPRTSTKSKS